MIPGPIEISPAVAEAAAAPPDSHVSPAFIEHYGSALERMRQVWKAGPEAQPVIVAGGGTLAMEIAVCNLTEPGDRALVVNTGYFGDRMAEMLARRGVHVDQVRAEPGSSPSTDDVAKALDAGDYKVMAVTHVDTSTGVRTDAEALAKLARNRDVLSIFDGVCATAGERFDMEAWGADVYLTASQKAIGLPPGLALLVMSARAVAARRALGTKPPMTLDLAQWKPILEAYEARRPSYFSTPATTLVKALDVGLGELADIDAVFARHAQVADAMRAAWQVLGLTLLPADGLAANTLSAIRYPEGVGPELTKAIAARGVAVAGGLHPALKTQYFRVGHMGYSTRRPDHLLSTVRAVAEALVACGHSCDVEAAVKAVASRI
ncbi:MAG: alanine--glyoxylate aminotransferase family protein [Deltaproteobacteria bacterium]|nr:MAG: alanine--glyoxylate aminotransferase family protein [Deltaproteobacteria bacterium]